MDPVIILVAGIYFAASLGLGFWVGRKEKNVPDDYFLASRKLPWYAISLSMTGANIGTEHFLGMVGTAYAVGLAPAVFEWGNLPAYSILTWIFLPYFFRKKLYTIPEFLERRYSPATRAIFALLSMLHMVLGVLAPALYAGGRILYEMPQNTAIEGFNWGFMGCVGMISAITAAYCIYGGLLSVVWTDVLQVIVLALGGLLLTAAGILQAGGIEEVVSRNLAADQTRMSLFQDASHPVAPWTGVATLWITLSLWYVCTNQFYIQRCLGARSEWDAKMGVLSCAMTKFFLPFIIVFPGLIAFALYGPGIAEDHVYITMVTSLLPPVGQGILLATLIAAIMSTVSAVLNSASTVWSMDIYKRLIHPGATDAQIVRMGRWSTLVIILIGTLLAPVLLRWEGGIFIYIQNIAAMIAPPIAVIFLCAFLWKRAHANAANITLVFGMATGVGLFILGRVSGKEWLDSLLNRAAIAEALCLLVMVLAVRYLPKPDGETYDRDAIWSLEWAHLPEAESPLNRGYRNLMFWWIALIAITATLYVAFR